MLTLPALARALGGKVNGRSVLAPGPNHSKRDGSMSVTLSATSPYGFIAHSFSGDDWRDCRDHVLARLGIPPDRPAHRVERVQSRPAPQTAEDDEARRIAGARTIWRAAHDARGSLVDRYMKARGFDHLDDRDALTIRFAPAFRMKLKDDTRVTAPAMICAIRDIRGTFDRLAHERGELAEAEAAVLADDELVVGIHATALLDDGSGKRFGGDSRRIHGVLRNAGVLLGDVWGPLAYGTSVAFCEGVEDARAALALGAGTAIACGSAGAIEKFDPIPSIMHVVFVVENDANGASEKSIRVAASRWREHTQDVRVIRSTLGKDLADICGGAA